ncbi:T9SS type B sorting domain-containing protein [Mariniflexile sp.]
MKNNSLDGTYNGLQMPSNDYWYLIKCNDGKNDNEYTSHFSLKR